MATSRMAPAAQAPQSGYATLSRSESNEARASSISWAAVIGGAVVAASVSLILLILGTGIGLSSISPWSSVSAASATVGKAAIIWLVISQIIASLMGGYLAGRLRTKWVDVHTDEVYFRDTAHGFLVWGVGVLIAAAFIISAGAYAAGKTAQGATASTAAYPNAYFVDSLFRPGASGTLALATSANSSATSSTSQPAGLTDTEVRAQAGNILANSMRQNGVSDQDQGYLAQLIAARTGMTQSDAQSRVSQVIGQAQQDADAARKAAAHLAYWAFFALLVGAFCASFAATLGGAQRDHVRV